MTFSPGIIVAKRPTTPATTTGTAPSGGSPGGVVSPPSLPAKAAAGGVASAVDADPLTVDAVAALASSAEGVRFLDSMRGVFGPKRFDLYRAFALYDTPLRRRLNVSSFLAALASAGLKLTHAQGEALKAVLTSAAAAPPMAGGKASSSSWSFRPSEHDVLVDYNDFFDTLWA